MKAGFDNTKYLKTQSLHIDERIEEFGGKLYLEFGGKLFDDYHASRVFPGFEPDSKINMLSRLKDRAEAIIAINSNDIERNKIRGDLGISYDLEALRLIDSFTARGIEVAGLVLTMYEKQPAAKTFEKKLKNLGIKVYHHFAIEGYPNNVSKAVSDSGFGKNEFVATTKPLVVVTAPGPGSGKMAVCLSQLYHESKSGVKAGYAKFETFPVWNLPLEHPVNVAYEAATADLNDKNMVDPFHKSAYRKTAVNYNRDIEIFPILNAILEMILGKSPYKSPTDMGVNMVGHCISDDKIVRKAAKDEIVRRYFKAKKDWKLGLTEDDSVAVKIKSLMDSVGITETDRPVVVKAREKAKASKAQVAVAIELDDGKVITGKTGETIGAAGCCILNALKTLAGIPDEVHLVPPEFIDKVKEVKIGYLGEKNPKLTINDVLTALAIYSSENKDAAKAMKQIPKLKGCEVHVTAIPHTANEYVFKKLGMNMTCDPFYQTSGLFQQR